MGPLGGRTAVLFAAAVPVTVVVMLIVLIWAWCAPIRAQGTAQQRQACTGDAITLCPNALPQGADAIRTCLIANTANLSRPCRAVFAHRRHK